MLSKCSYFSFFVMLAIRKIALQNLKNVIRPLCFAGCYLAVFLAVSYDYILRIFLFIGIFLSLSAQFKAIIVKIKRQYPPYIAFIEQLQGVCGREPYNNAFNGCKPVIRQRIRLYFPAVPASGKLIPSRFIISSTRITIWPATANS